MLRLADALLLLLLAALPCARSATPYQVISGVFLTPENTLEFADTAPTCNSHGAALANVEQVTNAYLHGYEDCKWGWVEGHSVLMLRLNPSEKCTNYSLGIVHRECLGMKGNSVFCFKSDGASDLLYPITAARLISYEEAVNRCASNGDKVATRKQIEKMANPTTTIHQHAWYDYGVGIFRVNTTTFEVTPCVASAYCYNAQLPDFLIQRNDKTWKRILIACILGSIFLILLFAAVFMRGNQFVCCPENRRTVKSDVPGGINLPPPPVPTWNTTSSFRPLNNLMDPKYVNTSDFVFEKRPPVIHPDMSKYRIHTYSNLGFDTTGDE